MSVERWVPFERSEPDLSSALLDLSAPVCEEPELIELASRTCAAAVRLLAQVSWASVTTQFDPRPATVAATDVRALILDHAQYRDGAGPALDAIRTGGRVVRTRTNRGLQWTAVRPVADALGVAWLIALPLHAGGAWIGSLNLYGTRPLQEAESLDSSVVSGLVEHLERGIDGYLACQEG
jgi:transcriptional regulator with GAF, ATPase, and Fis domain